MAASSCALAVDRRLLKYDVFISFRGETRNSFTSHLYFALCQKHIKAYIDEVSLEKGDDIERALPRAIGESAISIIIFSENYASSRWCLDELVHILKCKKEKDQIVLTIFYGIDPSHIRHQKGTYAAAFVEHEKRFKDKMDKVEEWKQALKRAADLSGWNSQGKSESVLVQEVVEDVMRKLQSISSTSIDDLKGLFGIHRQLCIIESLLDSPNVCILGIWGMGGIGKTTLASVVFKCLSNRFEGTCFLESVREESQRKGLVELEKEMFSKLLGEKDPDVSNCFVNIRLSRTKALLVLDDVASFEHLKRLAGDRDRFGPGSKIIVTSRNLEVLNQLIDETYEVQALDLENEASQLFYSKAFEENSCRTGYEKISAKVVRYTGGNPLALQVLGSYFKSLGSLGIETWESALEKLKRTLPVDILEVLRISYDGLDTEERDAFLDIACFLKDKKRDFVEDILEHKSSIVITNLVHKSLITIDQDGKIRMHDLIQEMGWEIVRQSTKKRRERSRLWTAEDASNVLENNKGTEAIEGIYLPWIEEDKELHLRSDVFEEMCILRLLKIFGPRRSSARPCKVKVYIDGNFEYLPKWLRYLHWEDYPGKSLPSNFKPHNLVELQMPNSKLQQLWDGVQKFGSLKHINLFDSKVLNKIPDLSVFPKLESINLTNCLSLINIPSLNLQATFKDRYQCLRVEFSIYEDHAQRSPGCIILSGCESLRTLPKVSGNITRLVLSGSALKDMHSSIESLDNLLRLDLDFCYDLKSLPKLPRNIVELVLDCSGIEQIPSSSIECLYNLQILSLRYCRSLESLPMLSGLSSLTELDLSYSNIREIPASIGILYKLKILDIRMCKNLQSLPELPWFIQYVNAQDCSSLEMVSTLGSTFTRGRWLFNYNSYCYTRIFSFIDCTNCTKLAEVAINNIFRVFLNKVFCNASSPPEVVESKPEKELGELIVCYPTKEIPRWFKNQSEGSSITITLPQNWYNPETFLGFVVSVIVVSEFVYERYSGVECILHLRTNRDSFRVNYGRGFIYRSRLDHIAMWYSNFDHSRVNFEKEYEVASFEFKSQPGLKVKQCGVRMLYLGDADVGTLHMHKRTNRFWQTLHIQAVQRRNLQ